MINTAFLVALILDVFLYVYYFVVSGVSFAASANYVAETVLFRSHVITTTTLIRCTWTFHKEDLPWNLGGFVLGLAFDIWNSVIAGLATSQADATTWALQLAVPIAFSITSCFGIFSIWITNYSSSSIVRKK
jgi:hypothetical protein